MKIKFVPQNITIEGSTDKSLLELAFDNQIPIKSICKGVPSCGECRVKIAQGENNVNPPSRLEQSILGTNYFLDGRRLSCQVRCFGDVTIDMQEQLLRDETQNKKIRGFKSNKQYESKAVLDTMILKEKSDEQSKK
ncbi:MAG: (2Fe-2S)-binding protein [Bdellovibrionaceae bacterium]|nr:(2Fe-2S)-binding protein [Pseudobdellovibrionaceae bacterium]NUM57817.1 (2Fe-2S)-binding protein [Pseudobdellovibrionaceae bacterium]